MTRQTRSGLRYVARRGSGAARRAAQSLGRLEARLLTADEQRRAVGGAMSRHDMVEERDEAYYRDRYLAWIDRELERAAIGPGAALLDAGCGSGRLLVPVAQRLAGDGARVVGIDFLADSLAAADRHARAAGLREVELVEGDLLDALRGRADAEFDAALFLEVAFVVTDLDAVLAELARTIRPGGLLLASFRTRFWWLLTAARRRDWDLLDTVQARTAGVLPGAGFQTWHGAADARAQLEGAGFGDVRLRGIGALSGIEGDPLAGFVRPSELDSGGERALARAEDALAESHPDIGRYVLASAVRGG